LDQFCATQTQNVLIIDGSDFINTKGQYNVTYTIKVRMEWVNRVNDTDYLEYAELQGQVKWLNYSIPSFTLEGPSDGHVKVTADFNRFSITLRNYEIPDLSVLNVDW
jgi:hypothetical protein